MRGFLGLTGYYRKFVKSYGKIAVPLTSLLKENDFIWTLTTDKSFQELKESMCINLVLSLPDFTKNFFLECDASDKGIGAVLMQEGKASAFTSKKLLKRHLDQFIYEKKMLAILHVVDL
jgi:hypothetical protein